MKPLQAAAFPSQRGPRVIRRVDAFRETQRSVCLKQMSLRLKLSAAANLQSLRCLCNSAPSDKAWQGFDNVSIEAV